MQQGNEFLVVGTAKNCGQTPGEFGVMILTYRICRSGF